MELFTNKDTKFLFTGITVFIVGFLLLILRILKYDKKIKSILS